MLLLLLTFVWLVVAALVVAACQAAANGDRVVLSDFSQEGHPVPSADAVSAREPVEHFGGRDAAEQLGVREQAWRAAGAAVRASAGAAQINVR